MWDLLPGVSELKRHTDIIQKLTPSPGRGAMPASANVEMHSWERVRENLLFDGRKNLLALLFTWKSTNDPLILGGLLRLYF